MLIYLSQPNYDEESVFKQLLGLKDSHIQAYIQANASVCIIPDFKKLEPFMAGEMVYLVICVNITLRPRSYFIKYL